ncbi:MAG: hypothetical protein V7K64_14710 [Nostoc sp.]|uniref:Eco57I restriction-modification methylase domain-containing protein n=1 Tax=Nostoc sp. TaxID=1180 RepID=UPI002FF46EC6
MIYTLEQAVDRYPWWASLKHGGLLIAPSRLAEFFVADIEPLPSYIEDRLRRDVTRVRNGEKDITTLLDTVLQDVLKLSKDWWIKGNAVDSSWSQRAITGETIRPRRVWQDPHGGMLPVFDTDVFSRLGIGKGRRAVSRVIEWLRKANQKIALLTNGRQWRLIHAGSDYDAWCEWDIDLWFEEGKPGLQVLALRLLLGEQSLHPEKPEKPSPLITAIQASRQGQAELSDVLGERVRKAVELLIKESSPAIADRSKDITPLETADNPVSSRDIYIAATRMIMRCVVILFAEARDLLDRTNQIYYDSYSISGLREQLERLSGGRAGDRLRNGYSAWSRLLALFRLVYFGCSHEKMPIPRYGGGLFTPGDVEAKDPILRALAAFENPDHTPSDAVVYRILELLSRSKVKVRQGRSNSWVEAPVDFSDLSSEYIGILYEGLLDFELRRAEEQEPILFLNLGDQPALPLSRLEGMDDAALAALVEKLKQKSKVATSEDEEEAEEEEVAEIEGEAEETEEIEAETPAETELEELEADGDLVQELRERAYQWAVRAVKAGKLVAKPRSKKAAALAEYEQAVSKVAKNLIVRIILPGEWFLVRWGGTRKGSGTFYTRPQLAIPTTRRTLQALVYEKESPIPKKPEEILALKVCDPAMGSGSFLVAALRFLTETLYESLHYHNRIEAHGNDSLCRLADGTGTNSLMEETLPVLPDHPDFEGRLKALLKRYIVERCIYGVDIDPLAVELGRLSLWVETMDRRLPFSFVDHKLKCGNSLVGCWFDRFRDYPTLAWEREGGDKNHTRGVNYQKETWTKAIKEIRNKRLKTELRDWIEGKQSLFEQVDGKTPEIIHDEALQVLDEIHSLKINQTKERTEIYINKIIQNRAFATVKEAFDTWCATWFWNVDEIDDAPLPLKFSDPNSRTREIVAQLAEEYRFFHWELEFPNVFAVSGGGFDAIIGNPPWENLQPNPAEFFSNYDPLFRTYGRLEALTAIERMFSDVDGVEREWLSYCSKFKAYANWVRNVFSPFGDENDGGTNFNLGGKSKNLHSAWRDNRTNRKSYADPSHPFQYQGGGRIFTEKLFLELCHALLKNGGIFSLIVPPGIYTVKGMSELRNIFLNQCQWTHLYVFQNERFIFRSIDHRNKIVVLTVKKGGGTSTILTRFRLGAGDSPEAYELESNIINSEYYFPISVTDIIRFSPNTKAILEIRSLQDLKVLNKIYGNSVRLGDKSQNAWQIRYTLEFMMNTDVRLFPSRTKWEANGYYPDEYGHWLKGNWQLYENSHSILKRSEGLIFSIDGSYAIKIDEIEDVALPFYQGVMIWQFDFSAAGYVSGSGNRANWEAIKWNKKKILPQFLMGLNTYKSTSKYLQGLKLVFRDISNATNERTMIASALEAIPCGNVLGVLEIIETSNSKLSIGLLSCLNSFVYDYHLRNRMGGTHLNLFIIEDTAVLSPKNIPQKLYLFSAQLAICDVKYASHWLNLNNEFKLRSRHWKQFFALTEYERLRLRCILDAVITELYGLEIDDLAWILQDCDYPANKVCDKSFARTLEPKAFWRVDKEKDPELRHTVLSLVAFHELKKIGLEAFLNLNDGEGWMLPETLRLADYRLGHDDRAMQPQPVASRLGERFLPWQLEGTAEESWEECERHAENLRLLLGEKSLVNNDQLKTENNPDSTKNSPPNSVQLSIFDQPTEEI